MGMQQIPFVPMQGKSRSSTLDAQVCINFFAEQAPSKDAESEVMAVGVPGLKVFSSLSTGPIRAFHIVNDLLYVVSGPGLFSLSKTGVVSDCGTGIAGSSVVNVADNGQQILIVNGQEGYLYQISTNTLTQIGPNTVIDVQISSEAVPGDEALNITVTTTNQTVENITIPSDITGPGIPPGTSILSVSGNILNISAPITQDLPVGTALVVTVIGTNAFYPAKTVTFIDGYFVLERTGTAEFFYSGLYNGATYNGLDYATKESNSDFLQGVINLHQLLILIGERTSELWYDSGTTDAPFSPYTSSAIQRGTAAPYSIVLEDNAIFFLGDDLIFYRFQTYLPVRISTHVEESVWASYGSYADAFAFVTIWQGHKFINLTFPSAPGDQPRTWVFDIATSLWHVRDSVDQDNVSMARWRGNAGIMYFGQTLIGDCVNGNVGVWDYDTFTEYGNTIVGQVSSPPIHKNRRRIFMRALEVYMESGTGLQEGEGSDPQIYLDYSDDGGKTWSARKLPQSFGPQGQYKKRCRWLRLGQARTRTLRLTITDPVRRNIIGAYLDVQAGES